MIVVELMHPKWNYFQNFFIPAYLHSILVVDAQPDVNPLNFYAEDVDGVNDAFDYINYNKGASVMRMFMHAIGEDAFKKALHSYLTNNTLGSVDERDLFQHFDAAIAENKVLPTDYTMDKLFGSWTRQAGFPVLKVTRNYKDGTVTIQQQKYNAIYEPDEPIDSKMWWIPYNFASASNATFGETTPVGWLSNNERQKRIESIGSRVTWTNDDWLLFNIEQTGYYRVWYDDENYNLISKELNNGDLNKIHPINRAQILDDLHHFVYSGRVSAKILCDVMTYLRKETEYVVWEIAKNIFMNWNENLQTSNKLTDFKELVGNLVEPLYQKITLKEADDEDLFDKFARWTAVSLACEFGVSQCLKDTYTEFQNYINGMKLSPDARILVIQNGIRSATDEEVAELWEIFLNNSDVDERQEIISSFGYVPNDSIAELYFNETISDKSVSVWERWTFVTSFIENRQNRVSFFIQFLSNNLDSIETFGTVSDLFNLIAGKIRKEDVQTQFYALLMSAGATELISVDDIADLKTTAAEVIQWQTQDLHTFERSFFTGTCMLESKINTVIPADEVLQLKQMTP